MTSWRIVQGDAVEQLRGLPAGSVQTCITSPPFYGLRDYNAEGQLGLEATPDEYVARLVDVFREVRRVLRDDATAWLNLGDSFLPNKQLAGIPWRCAFALQADGWWLRSDIVWAKPNPMPESVTDRPTRAHEYVFLLTKRPRYFYNTDAIREKQSELTLSMYGHRDEGKQERARGNYSAKSGRDDGGDMTRNVNQDGRRNKRSVWHVATQPFPGAHFAVFPAKLIEPCVLAGSPPKCCGACGAPWERVTLSERIPTQATNNTTAGREESLARPHGERSRLEVRTLGWRSTCGHDDDTGRSTVLDPFAGAGTTGVVALRHNRSFIGIELNLDYVQLARHRIMDDAPLFNTPAEVAA